MSFWGGLFFLGGHVLGCFCVFYAIVLSHLCAAGRRVCCGLFFFLFPPPPRISRPRLGNEIAHWYSLRVGFVGEGRTDCARALTALLISRSPLAPNLRSAIMGGILFLPFPPERMAPRRALQSDDLPRFQECAVLLVGRCFCARHSPPMTHGPRFFAPCSVLGWQYSGPIFRAREYCI